MVTNQLQLRHAAANPQGLVAEFGQTGDSGIYDEVRVSVLRPDGLCIGDVLVGLNEKGELRVLVTANADGDGEHPIAIYPQRPLDSAVEVESTPAGEVPSTQIVIHTAGGFVQGIAATRPVDILVCAHDEVDEAQIETMLIPDVYGLQELGTWVHKTIVYPADIRPAGVATVHAAAKAANSKSAISKAE